MTDADLSDGWPDTDSPPLNLTRVGRSRKRCPVKGAHRPPEGRPPFSKYVYLQSIYFGGYKVTPNEQQGEQFGLRCSSWPERTLRLVRLRNGQEVELLWETRQWLRWLFLAFVDTTFPSLFLRPPNDGYWDILRIKLCPTGAARKDVPYVTLASRQAIPHFQAESICLRFGGEYTNMIAALLRILGRLEDGGDTLVEYLSPAETASYLRKFEQNAQQPEPDLRILDESLSPVPLYPWVPHVIDVQGLYFRGYKIDLTTRWELEFFNSGRLRLHKSFDFSSWYQAYGWELQYIKIFVDRLCSFIVLKPIDDVIPRMYKRLHKLRGPPYSDDLLILRFHHLSWPYAMRTLEELYKCLYQPAGTSKKPLRYKLVFLTPEQASDILEKYETTVPSLAPVAKRPRRPEPSLSAFSALPIPPLAPATPSSTGSAVSSRPEQPSPSRSVEFVDLTMEDDEQDQNHTNGPRRSWTDLNLDAHHVTPSRLGALPRESERPTPSMKALGKRKADNELDETRVRPILTSGSSLEHAIQPGHQNPRSSSKSATLPPRQPAFDEDFSSHNYHICESVEHLREHIQQLEEDLMHVQREKYHVELGAKRLEEIVNETKLAAEDTLLKSTQNWQAEEARLLQVIEEEYNARKAAERRLEEHAEGKWEHAG